MNKKTYLFSNLLAWGILVLLVGNYVFGWSTPSSDPPEGNVVLPWTISGSDVYYDDGNVGIGTTEPSGLLHLKKNFVNGVAIIYDRTENANVDSLFYSGVSTGGTTATDFMWLGTATTNFVIRGDGNVGIGTTNPGAKLEVNGNIIADTPTADNHVATKEYVDAAVVGGYTDCYINCTSSNIDCSTGYTAILTTKGTGCTTVPNWTFIAGAGFFRIVTCQTGSTGGSTECLQVGGPSTASIDGYCDGCTLSVICKAGPSSYANQASTCQVCCK